MINDEKWKKESEKQHFVHISENSDRQSKKPSSTQDSNLVYSDRNVSLYPVCCRWGPTTYHAVDLITKLMLCKAWKPCIAESCHGLNTWAYSNGP